MKKESFLLTVLLLLCLLLGGCGAKENTDFDTKGEPPVKGEQTMPAMSNTPDKTAAEPPAMSEAPSATAELLPPVMEWWELYNPNGFDTVTALISNPNEIAVDVSYDLVFYKDGSEVSRIEYCLNESILPGHEDIIWANVGVPGSNDADEVRMENLMVTETIYPPVEGSYEYQGIIDGEARYAFKFEQPIEIATIFLVQYNDDNGNGQFDRGEIVVAEINTLLEQEGIVSYETDVFPSTDCFVVFKAY